MELKDLRKKIVGEISSCFMVENGKIYELKIRSNHNDEKDVSDFYKAEPCSFTVGFENPNNKEIWKPDYAIPFIDIIGIESNGKLILSDYKQAGYDLPNRPYTIHGNFFLDRESAELYLSALIQKVEKSKTKKDVIKDLKEIIEFAHNFVDSEAADLFEEKIENVISSIKKME